MFNPATLWTKVLAFISFRDLLYAAALAVLLVSLFRQGQATITAQANARAANEQMQVFKNREGQYVARISTLSDVRSLITSQDSTLRKLARAVDHQTQAAAVFTTLTTTLAAGRTDTVKVFKKGRPVYRAVLRKPWATYWLRMDTDSAFVRSETRNEFLVRTHRQRFGFLNLKSKLVTDVTSTNPDTGLQQLRSYEAPAPRAHFVLGPIIGLGIGPGLTPAPFVGLGITYPLLSW